MGRLICSIAILLCLCSCRDGNNGNLQLNEVERIIEAYPDSALSVLDDIQLPVNDLTVQNRYFLYRIWAKDVANKDIHMDKEILDVYNYFKSSKDEKLAGFAAYYCGRILLDNNELDQALTYLNIAEAYAIKHDDKELHGIILYYMGRLMLDKYMVEESVEKVHEASLLLAQTKKHKLEIKSQKMIGFYYLLSEKNDSAMIYYNRALNLAKKYDDKEEIAFATQDIGVVYEESGDFVSALESYKKALRIHKSPSQYNKMYLNLSEGYLNIGKSDSARYYANRILSDTCNLDASLTAGVYDNLSRIEERAGNFSEALRFHKLYSENLAEILEDMENSAVINADSKYKYEVVQNENARLTLRNMRIQILLVLFLLLIAIIIIIYTVELLRKNKQLIMANEEIVSLMAVADELNYTKESYLNSLTHNFAILKRAAFLEYHVQDSCNKQGRLLIKRFNEIAYGEEAIDWDVIYNIVNTINKGLFERLKSVYKDLDENEFKICCLIYSNFTSTEIAAITQLSINTVHVKTTNVRKKLGIKKYGNITDFINERLK